MFFFLGDSRQNTPFPAPTCITAPVVQWGVIEDDLNEECLFQSNSPPWSENLLMGFQSVTTSAWKWPKAFSPDIPHCKNRLTGRSLPILSPCLFFSSSFFLTYWHSGVEMWRTSSTLSSSPPLPLPWLVPTQLAFGRGCSLEWLSSLSQGVSSSLHLYLLDAKSPVTTIEIVSRHWQKSSGCRSPS